MGQPLTVDSSPIREAPWKAAARSSAVSEAKRGLFEHGACLCRRKDRTTVYGQGLPPVDDILSHSFAVGRVPYMVQLFAWIPYFLA